MLLRHQVLLTDWQTDHLKMMAKRSDISFSEMIRILLCEGMLRAGMIMCPECKDKVDIKKLDELTAKGSDINTEVEERHKIISEVYFETRKLADYIDDMAAKEEKGGKR